MGKSPSTRRAWIEMLPSALDGSEAVVALHPEGVDRNHGEKWDACHSIFVALHPEGVGRKQIVTLDFWT